MPFLFSTIFYFMANFERDAHHFFVFFATTLTNHYIAVTCAMTCVTAARHFAGASLIANLCYTLQSLACGMFIQADSIPVYVRWLKWITYTVSAIISVLRKGTRYTGRGRTANAATSSMPSPRMPRTSSTATSMTARTVVVQTQHATSTLVNT